MIGPDYWCNGIKIEPFEATGYDRDWKVTLKFYDDGFAEDGSTEGTLVVRYLVKDATLESAIDTLIEDAQRLGIIWQRGERGPTVCVKSDGELEDGDRPDLRKVANDQARRLGWNPCYSIRSETVPWPPREQPSHVMQHVGGNLVAMDRESHRRLHATLRSSAEVECDRLTGLLADAHAGLLRALDFRAGTPEALAIKANVRDTLRRTGFTGPMGEMEIRAD